MAESVARQKEEEITFASTPVLSWEHNGVRVKLVNIYSQKNKSLLFFASVDTELSVQLVLGRKKWSKTWDVEMVSENLVKAALRWDLWHADLSSMVHIWYYTEHSRNFEGLLCTYLQRNLVEIYSTLTCESCPSSKLTTFIVLYLIKTQEILIMEVMAYGILSKSTSVYSILISELFQVFIK